MVYAEVLSSSKSLIVFQAVGPLGQTSLVEVDHEGVACTAI